MKKYAILAVFLFAQTLFGAAWTVNTTAGQDARFVRQAAVLNTATCARVALGPGCTQGQARTAFCAQPGSSGPAPCTVNGQSSGDIKIFSTAGEFLDKYVIDVYFAALKQAQELEDLDSFRLWRLSASQAQKDAVCTAAGLSAGCLP